MVLPAYQKVLAQLGLDPLGHVAELATANIWLVRDGAAHTPVPNGTFLNGIMHIGEKQIGFATRHHPVGESIGNKARIGLLPADARIPQLLQRDGMRIGLHRIQHVARKAVEKLFGGAGEFFRMH